MQFLAWAFIGLMALILTMFWMIFERRVPVTTLAATFLWAIWSWQAIRVDFGTSVVLRQSYPSLRWFGIFMVLINVMLLLLWLWVEDDEALFSRM